MLVAYENTFADRDELNEWLLGELEGQIMNTEWLYRLYMKKQFVEAIEGSVDILNEYHGYHQMQVHVKEQLSEILQQQYEEEYEREEVK